MGQLIDERNLGAARKNGRQVQLSELGAAVTHLGPGHDLELSQLLLGVYPSVGLDERDDNVGSAGGSSRPFVEHREGLADARGDTEIDAQFTSRHRPPRPYGRRQQLR
jgi:hypothetical protein